MQADQPLNYLFLYTRLPDYFFQCIRHLLQTSPAGSKAWIVCYPQDKNAPYEYQSDNNIVFIDKPALDEKMVDSIQPHVIYIAGWGDKLYNRIGRKKKLSIPIVMGLDNPWKGNPRQKISCLLASFFQRKICSHIWVAGLWQYEYARRLGFPSSNIITGLYCAATDANNSNTGHTHKRIIFVGRLVPYKKPDWLVKAFAALQQEYPVLQEWKLTIIGSGPMKETLQQIYVQHRQIEFISFLQPSAIKKYYTESAIFCLPAHYEHWGVVVQEAAAAGLPLLLSDTCGASTEFLVNGLNGYLFNSNSYEDFKEKLQRLMIKDTGTLQKMGAASSKLAGRINHVQWAGTFKSVLVNKQHG